MSKNYPKCWLFLANKTSTLYISYPFHSINLSFIKYKMEIHKEELKIIDLFRKNLFLELTIKQLMKRLNKKSYNWTYNALQKLRKDILNIKKKGNTTLISLNLDNSNTINYLSFLDKKEAFNRKVPLVNEIIKSISKKTPFFIFLITGSYAINKQRKNSDLDIVIIVNNDIEQKDITPYLKDIIKFADIEIDYHIIKKDEFNKMLLDEKENFGKEIFRKHLLMYGQEAYYQIIKEAIQNGLQRKI